MNIDVKNGYPLQFKLANKENSEVVGYIKLFIENIIAGCGTFYFFSAEENGEFVPFDSSSHLDSIPAWETIEVRQFTGYHDCDGNDVYFGDTGTFNDLPIGKNNLFIITTKAPRVVAQRTTSYKRQYALCDQSDYDNFCIVKEDK